MFHCIVGFLETVMEVRFLNNFCKSAVFHYYVIEVLSTVWIC